MVRTTFTLAGTILVGGGLIALSVDLALARGVGIAMSVTGLGVIAYASAAMRSRATGRSPH